MADRAGMHACVAADQAQAGQRCIDRRLTGFSAQTLPTQARETVHDRATRAAHRTYEAELAVLGQMFEIARGADVAPLKNLLDALAGGCAVFVGSGGALAAAAFAAEGHTAATGHASLGLTPLQALGDAPTIASGLVVLSARARHPDVRLALEAARSKGYRVQGLITTRPPSDFASQPVLRDAWHVALPAQGPDGFLATSSLLTMFVMLARARGADLPQTLDTDTEYWERLRPRSLILYGPRTHAVALDLEARLSETGASAATLTDYRNFGHGRHVGLMRVLDDTSIIALSNPETQPMVDATLQLLPDRGDVRRVSTHMAGDIGIIDLLVQTMRAVRTTPELNPAHPRVASFGRRLYRLPVRGLVPSRGMGPVDRKLRDSGIAADPGTIERYSAGYSEWAMQLAQMRFRGLVLDYDGTVCDTEARFQPPSRDVQDRIIDLLRGGMVVGFASGRGNSLVEGLKSWVPRDLWDGLVVGLYNGARIVGLSAEAQIENAQDGATLPALDAVAERLLADGGWQIASRSSQLTVQSMLTTMPVATAAARIGELAGRAPILPIKIVTSGHSVDVIAPACTKTAVLYEVERLTHGPAIAIGDQGQLGGNDFDLLAATQWSLSVDRCSMDPTRCWNLTKIGRSGPRGLADYLSTFVKRRDGWQFRLGHER